MCFDINLLTVEEVANRLRMGKRGPYPLIEREELPHVPIPGGSFRVLESDLLAYIVNRRRIGDRWKPLPERLRPAGLEGLGRLLTVVEVAGRLKMGKKGPYKPISLGELPHVLVGKRSKLVLELDLAEFVRTRRRQGNRWLLRDDDDDFNGPGSPSLPVPKRLTQSTNGKHIRRDVA
ncbi:Helix-turn-helix domain protein [Crateriforma conspicua]|uniref:Helix-turn-helix domain protein n=1 Tax=Crateriforma conspicua TaxID=2527996 RepID=A0A5C6FQH4_9PLAN|nr:helix-turn-helix domain-containing protein [Crateriforma conspicua]TWU64514.1 Helix-turn-helix domain protein [Crateriforma conspicua]